jgi:hypothetical protein
VTGEEFTDAPHPRRRRNPSVPVPVELSLKRQAAGIASWRGTVDRRALAGAEGLLATFEKQVPEEITDPAERRARAVELRRAYYLTLSAKAAAAGVRMREAQRTIWTHEANELGITDPAEVQRYLAKRLAEHMAYMLGRSLRARRPKKAEKLRAQLEALEAIDAEGGEE